MMESAAAHPLSSEALPALATVLAVIVTQSTGLLVGRARARHGVPPPAISGPPEFERAFRVHQNTLEQLVVFLPALWIAARFGNTILASLFGFGWVLGRIAYAVGYTQAPEKRALGFLIGFLCSSALIVMALLGTLAQLR